MSQGARIVVFVGVMAVLGAAIFLLMDDAPGDEGGALGALSSGRGTASADELGSLPEATAGRPDAAQPTSLAPAVGTAAPSTALDEAARTEPVEATEQLQLSGRVLDPLGGPVAGARVVFHERGGLRLVATPFETDSEGPERPETRTDADGRFAFEVAQPEQPQGSGDGFARLSRGFKAQLAVVAPGFAVLAHECPELELPGADLGDLSLAYGTALHGVVLDEAGRAIDGAEIRVRTQLPTTGTGNALLMAISGGSLEQQYTRTRTDLSGRFHVEGLPAGEQTLEVVADGMQAGYRDDLLTEIGRPLDVGVITLEQGASIAGNVFDAEGEPLEGVSVRVSSLARFVVSDLEDSRPQVGREWQLRAVTDASGRFQLDGLSPGQYTVHARLDGYAPGERENVPTGARDVRMTLEPLSGAFVRVRSSRDGSPVEGARLQTSPRRGGPGGVRIVRGRAPSTVLEGAEALAAAGLDPAEESAAGAYFIQGIGPTGVLAEVVAPEFAVHELEVDGVVGGGVSSYEVSLLPASVLSGVVLDGAGEALADARVSVEAYVPPAPQADGVFSFTEEVAVNLGGGEAPVDWRSTRTDSSGRFRFDSLPAGDWEVEASSTDAAPGDPQIVTLDEGEERTGLVLQLQSAGWIAGRAVEENGDAIPNVDIVAKYLDAAPKVTTTGNAITEELLEGLGGGGGSRRTATADDEGRFELRGLEPGRWEVSLSGGNGVMMGGAAVFLVAADGGSADEQTAQIVNVSADTESFVELVRPPQSALEGRLTAAGEGVEGVSVKLAEANSFLPTSGQSVTTGPGGHFRFDDVRPGEYTVSALVPGAAHREQERVQLEPGRTAVQDIAFGGVTLRGRVVDVESGDGVEGAKITATPVVPQGSQGLSGFGGVQIVTRFESDDGGGGFDMTLGGGSSSSVRTDADGNFEVRFLDPGDWSLQTEGGGYTAGEAGPIELSDDRSSDEIVIEVQRAATLFGRVTDGATGLPLDGVPVSVGLVGGGFGGREITMTENGSYRVENLEPGEYELTVMGSGFGGEPLARETAFVKSGEQREVDLTTEG